MVGALAVGKGARTPYVSASASKLFGMSERAYYYWDLATLGAQRRR